MQNRQILVGYLILGGMYSSLLSAHEPHTVAPFGDQPLLYKHTPQQALAEQSAPYNSFIFINNIGNGLFSLPRNRLDGVGRPAATGDSKPTHREPIRNPAQAMSRLSGVDSLSCVGCHALPNVAGAGDFVANNFDGAEMRDEPSNKINEHFNERNTLAIQGSGPVELLAREMTEDLIKLREQAIIQAQSKGESVVQALVSKTISFGYITAYPNGEVDSREVEGIDQDLILKPFGRKGTTRSIREFTVSGLNRHHGIQAAERFGIEQTGTRDFDQDGVEDELSVGDITALVVYQAQLETPVSRLPRTPSGLSAAQDGELLFADIGCTSCHIPSLPLNNTEFCEPYARNSNGTFADSSQSYCFDLATTGTVPRIEPLINGISNIRVYSDLKRHKICDKKNPHYCNEQRIEAGVPVDQFLTAKLWTTGLLGLHGHRGDLTTIHEAISAHGGEAVSTRKAYQHLDNEQRASIVEFLKTLTIPITPGIPIQTPLGHPNNYSQTQSAAN